jgi:transcriptional regulator GlxA family with amidase domain
MQRRGFLKTSVAAAAGMGVGGATTGLAGAEASGKPIARGKPLTPPKDHGYIDVAFAIADGATIIDFCGPWEVFQDVMIFGSGGNHGDHHMPFRLHTVAATSEPITASGGMRIIPDHTFDDVPEPDLIVVPALRGNDALHDWLRATKDKTDVTISVCTGAFQLARAGLLDGLQATTHHDFYDTFAKEFPKVELERGLRFVETEHIATAGGLTSGIDLALRVVERYFGRKQAERTAEHMEYTGEGWRV